MAEPDSQQIEVLVREARNRAGEDRTSFLAEACQGNVLMRTKIEQLLAETEATASLAPPEATPPLPNRIGRYHVKRAIATGGMGIVYEAVQEQPHRTVALKVLRRGIASRSALRRFEYESQILARLRHPHIAQVYEAGTHDDGSGGVPFFAMEYIPGAKTLIEHVSDRKLDTKARLDIFVKICDAVQHGHQKGIIHRDLKPSNILVDSEGEPKIIDFGVARATDSDMAITTLQTDVGQLIGTLQYMSPEQCEADPHDLDARSDVYALGIVLYELLCGELPYDVSHVSVVEAARVIREDTPTKLSTINRTLRGDLETIAFKALDKDRTQRYQSAADLGADIGRYLGDQPIVARPPSAMYQLRKFARRNKLLVGGVATLIIVLAAATVVSAGFALSEAEQRRAAAREKDIAQAINDFLNEDLLAAVAPSAEAGRGRDVLMREVLDEAAKRIEEAAAPGGRFADKPLVEASIRLTLGRTYVWLSEYEAAETHIARAHELFRDQRGNDHLQTIAARYWLGNAMWEAGRYNEAASWIAETLALARRGLGDDDPGTMEIMRLHGDLQLILQNYDEAEKVLVEAYERHRQVLGPEDGLTVLTGRTLGRLYGALGRWEKAESLLQEQLDIRRRVWGDHRSTADAYNSLGLLYKTIERYEDAEAMLLKALEINRRILGDEHERTTRILLNLSALYYNQGSHARAETILVDLVPLRRRILGEKHPKTMTAVRLLAAVYVAQNRLEEAEPLWREALEFDRNRARRPDATALDKINYAWSLVRCELAELRDAETALAMAKRANEMTGHENPEYLDTLSMAYHQTGDTAKAIENQRKAIALLPAGGSYLRTRMAAHLAEFEAALADEPTEPADEGAAPSQD